MLDRSNGHRHARLTFRPGTDAPVSLQALNWRRLFACLKPYRGRMALATLALLISTGLGLAFPMVIVRLLDTVTHAKSAGALNRLALLLVGIFVVQAAFSFLQSTLLAVVGEHIVCDLRTALYGHLHRLSLDFYAGRRVGEIVSRLSSDVTQMRTVLTSNVTTLLSQSVSLVGALVIVATINAHLTPFILALFPALILVVAHRIAVLDGGRIVELGSHRELMALDGLYAHLYSMQFRDPPDAPLQPRKEDLISTHVPRVLAY